MREFATAFRAAFPDLAFAATGRTVRFTGTTVLTVENGLITEEVGLDDGVSVLRQLGLLDRS